MDALNKIIYGAPTSKPELRGAERSYGNYDDCYWDGYSDAEECTAFGRAETARKALAEYNSSH